MRFMTRCNAGLYNFILLAWVRWLKFTQALGWRSRKADIIYIFHYLITTLFSLFAFDEIYDLHMCTRKNEIYYFVSCVK